MRPVVVYYNHKGKRKGDKKMVAFIIVLVVIGSLVSAAELFCLACCAVRAYNVHKYGNDWGKLPDWLYAIVDKVAL